MNREYSTLTPAPASPKSSAAERNVAMIASSTGGGTRTWAHSQPSARTKLACCSASRNVASRSSVIVRPARSYHRIPAPAATSASRARSPPCST